MDPKLSAELQQLYQKDDIARTFFDYAANRVNNPFETPIDWVLEALKQAGTPVWRPDLIRVFRKLEDLDCGRLIVGRRTHGSRFAWALEITIGEVGRAARGEIVELST